jgi:hypothetical protein
MPHVARLFVLSACALVACGYAASPAGTVAPAAGGYAVARGAAQTPPRLDVQRLREAAPRAADVPPTHRQCALRRGTAC